MFWFPGTCWLMSLTLLSPSVRFFRKFNAGSENHTRMLAIHAAAQEYMNESGMPETSTSYFCSLVSILMEGTLYFCLLEISNDFLVHKRSLLFFTNTVWFFKNYTQIHPALQQIPTHSTLELCLRLVSFDISFGRLTSPVWCYIPIES